METSELLILLAILFLTLLFYLTSTFNYWDVREVRGPKPTIIFGTFKDFMLGRLSIGEFLKKIYDDYPNEPIVGLFERREACLMIKDPELIKDILIKNFSSFADRGTFKVVEKVEPLSQHLFNLEAERWRPLRNKLSPTFTSGKLKDMFYILLECAHNFGLYIDKSIDANNHVIEVRELTARFATDVIGNCAFGLKMNAMSEETSKFRDIGRKIFQVSYSNLIRLSFRETLPWLYNFLAPILYSNEVSDFFINTMMQNIKYRKENNIKRHDFVDLLIEIQDNPSKINDIELTDILLTAQAFVFFAAGYETSSSVTTNALYELALNHSIQDKVRNEINEELKKNDGILKYESIKDMKYLHKVFNESLRKYPSVLTLTRRAVENYKLPGTKLTIPKGMKVYIPAFAIHRDPKIYPDPDVFDPERFNEENINSRHPQLFLPFGDGPRNCIGARFGTYQTKIGLITVLKDYEVDICEKTQIPALMAPTALLYTPKSGVYLKFKKIEQPKA